MKTDKAFGGDRVAPSGVVGSMSHSSRSTVLSKQEFESVKMLLDANEDVARHPDVRKQTFRVFRMLQNFSKRFSERGTAVIDDDASSQSSEDPALALVEDLLQRHSNVDLDGEGEEEIVQTVDSETTGDVSSSQDSSSGVIEVGNDTPPMVADGVVGAKIEPPTDDSLKETHREPATADSFFGSCLLSSLCFLREEAKEATPMLESSAPVTVPIDDAPPGLVFRVTDAFIESRNDDEGETSMTRAVDEALRTLQDSAPRQIDEHDYEEDEAEGDEVLRVRLGRGGPYDNLLRILHNIKQSQGEGRESPKSSQSSDPRDESEAKAPAKLWLSLDRHAWKVQDSE
jgi:hypothetical protein